MSEEPFAAEEKDLPLRTQSSSKYLLWLVLGGGALLGLGVFYLGPAVWQWTGLESRKVLPRSRKLEPGIYVKLPDLLINLKADDSKSHFLKLCLVLDVKSDKDANQIKDFLPRIMDGFQVYLRDLHVKDLQGAEGIYRLKQNLLTRVNAEIFPVEVQEVLFREIFVQ